MLRARVLTCLDQEKLIFEGEMKAKISNFSNIVVGKPNIIVHGLKCK